MQSELKEKNDKLQRQRETTEKTNNIHLKQTTKLNAHILELQANTNSLRNDNTTLSNEIVEMEDQIKTLTTKNDELAETAEAQESEDAADKQDLRIQHKEELNQIQTEAHLQLVQLEALRRVEETERLPRRARRCHRSAA